VTQRWSPASHIAHEVAVLWPDEGRDEEDGGEGGASGRMGHEERKDKGRLT
jgi:hypothetical protein